MKSQYIFAVILLAFAGWARADQPSDTAPKPDPQAQIAELKDQNEKLTKLLQEYAKKYFACEEQQISMTVLGQKAK